jgi:hypothetical protein
MGKVEDGVNLLLWVSGMCATAQANSPPFTAT